MGYMWMMVGEYGTICGLKLNMDHELNHFWGNMILN
jgi:hypothetical protein